MERRTRISRKAIWRLLAAISILAMVFCSTGCGEEEAPDTTGEARQPAVVAPTTAATGDATAETVPPTVLTVNGAAAKAGDKAVTVAVAISGNPGILGMDFDVYYDDAVMTLTDAKSAIEDPGCVFTPPAYYRNPTSFLWDFQDAGWAEDGAIVTLTFDILETAPAGEYEVKLMYSYGNIFDANATPIDVKVTNATITVEES